VASRIKAFSSSVSTVPAGKGSVRVVTGMSTSPVLTVPPGRVALKKNLPPSMYMTTMAPVEINRATSGGNPSWRATSIVTAEPVMARTFSNAILARLISVCLATIASSTEAPPVNGAAI